MYRLAPGRTEYERALDLAKKQARTPLSGRTSLPLRDITGGKDWQDTPLLKSRMAGGFCWRPRQEELELPAIQPRQWPVSRHAR
jgi:hypothetical protein